MADRPGLPPRAWQRMLSGRRLDLIDPSPLDVEIEDIAHGLARVARWNGQTIGDHAFSVAQHALVVEDLAGLLEPGLDARQRLIVLLHDGPEYVIGDMISPFKAVMGGDYKAVEARLEEAIHRRFGLMKVATERLHRLTKKADIASAYFEAVELAGFTPEEARKIFGIPRGLGRTTPEGPRLGLVPMATVDAETAFIARFRALEKPDMIHVCSLARLAETVERTGARHLISLVNDGTPMIRPPSVPPENHLFLAMNDIVEPLEGMTPPGETHVACMLDWVAQRWDRRSPLVVHCFAGISRSTAAAYVIVAALSPRRSEAELARTLRHRSPSATPNRRIIAIADRLLGREGRMLAAIDAIGRGEDAFEGVPFRLDVDGH